LLAVVDGRDSLDIVCGTVKLLAVHEVFQLREFPAYSRFSYYVSHMVARHFGLFALLPVSGLSMHWETRFAFGTLTAVAWRLFENTNFVIEAVSRCHRVAALSG